MLRNFESADEPRYAIFLLRNRTRMLAVPLPVNLTTHSVGVRAVDAVAGLQRFARPPPTLGRSGS